MTTGRLLLPALLAGLAVAALLGLPRGAAVRVDAVLGRQRGATERVSAVLGRPPARLRAGPAARLQPLLARLRSALGRRRTAEQERHRAMEACTVLASELRAGRSAGPALDAAAAVASGPTATALRSAASAASLGGEVPAALTAPAGESAVPDLLRGLAACWAVCASTGSGLAAAVERLGEAERAAAEQRQAVEVELAGPRATARLLAVLPVVGLLMAAGLGAAPLAFLLGTAAGRVCLLGGVLLEVAGLRWTGRLAGRAARGG